MSHDTIADYASDDLTIVEVGEYEVLVDAGDAEASMDTAVEFENGKIGRVVELAGKRRLLVQVFSTAGLRVGQKIDVLAGAAGLAEPSQGTHPVSAFDYRLGGAPIDPPSPGLQEIDAARPPIESGDEIRDKVAPLAAGGVNLVINASTESVLDSMRSTVDAQRTIRVDGTPTSSSADPSADVAGDADITLHFEDDWQQLMALRIGAAWADRLRNEGESIAFMAQLPTPKLDGAALGRTESPRESVAELVNDLGRILCSTRAGRITTFLEVDVSNSGVAAIAETMGFGEVDAQWFLDEEGRFDPRRSTSSADLGPQAQRDRQKVLRKLEVARKARERSEIFGEFDLSDDEREALEFAGKAID